MHRFNYLLIQHTLILAPEYGGGSKKTAGLAQGPDGALYVSDDLKGDIFRIAYSNEKKKFCVNAAKQQILRIFNLSKTKERFRMGNARS